LRRSRWVDRAKGSEGIEVSCGAIRDGEGLGEKAG